MTLPELAAYFCLFLDKIKWKRGSNGSWSQSGLIYGAVKGVLLRMSFMLLFPVFIKAPDTARPSINDIKFSTTKSLHYGHNGFVLNRGVFREVAVVLCVQIQHVLWVRVGALKRFEKIQQRHRNWTLQIRKSAIRNIWRHLQVYEWEQVGKRNLLPFSLFHVTARDPILITG